MAPTGAEEGEEESEVVGGSGEGAGSGEAPGGGEGEGEEEGGLLQGMPSTPVLASTTQTEALPPLLLLPLSLPSRPPPLLPAAGVELVLLHTCSRGSSAGQHVVWCDAACCHGCGVVRVW